jgi:hypothetical protein
VHHAAGIAGLAYLGASPFAIGSRRRYGRSVATSAMTCGARRGGRDTLPRCLPQHLPVAASLGIDPALGTCDDTNVGSRKVIEANGGVLEDQLGVKLRFWVPTSG